jgi:hypothetical protein
MDRGPSLGQGHERPCEGAWTKTTSAWKR